MKKCNCCKVEKPLDEFSRLHSTKDGRAYMCITCGRAKTKFYRDKNREAYNLNQQAVRRTEKGFIAQLLHGAKTRAKKKGWDYNLSEDFIQNLLTSIDYRCQVTGQEMTLEAKSYNQRSLFKVSLDRIDSTKGYTEYNVQLICWAVNQMKNNLTEEEFKFWIDTVHKAISSQA